MKQSRIVPVVASSALSLGIPAYLLLLGTGAERADMSPAMGVLIIVLYVSVLYAVAGGFEWSQEPLPKWRSMSFLFLGGLGLAILFGIGWLGIRLLIEKILKVPAVANFRLSNPMF